MGGGEQKALIRTKKNIRMYMGGYQFIILAQGHPTRIFKKIPNIYTTTQIWYQIPIWDFEKLEKPGTHPSFWYRYQSTNRQFHALIAPTHTKSLCVKIFFKNFFMENLKNDKQKNFLAVFAHPSAS